MLNYTSFKQFTPVSKSNLISKDIVLYDTIEEQALEIII